MTSNHDILKKAIHSAIEGGKSILEIYDSGDFGTEVKSDNSPLTLADIASNKSIMSHLDNLDIPIISEENKQTSYEVRKNWDQFWLIDPLDGTKEFIKKNGEFTVNIALCSGRNPIFGVIYVPVSRELYYGDVEMGKAYKSMLNDNHELDGNLFEEKDRIYPSKENTENLRLVGSRSHMNQHTLDYIETVKNKYNNVEIVSKGSSLKFCLVAEGKADVYPRYAPTMEWDTAAGHAICNAVGLKVTSKETNEALQYNKENLLNSHFLVHK